jgi:hypothetical protein
LKTTRLEILIFQFFHLKEPYRSKVLTSLIRSFQKSKPLILNTNRMKHLIFSAIVLMLFSCKKTELEQKAPPSSHKIAGRTADGNKSLLFGPGSYIKVDDASALRLTTFTLEAWVMPTGRGATTQSGAGGVRGMPIITKGRGEGDYLPVLMSITF